MYFISQWFAVPGPAQGRVDSRKHGPAAVRAVSGPANAPTPHHDGERVVRKGATPHQQPGPARALTHTHTATVHHTPERPGLYMMERYPRPYTPTPRARSHRVTLLPYQPSLPLSPPRSREQGTVPTPHPPSALAPSFFFTGLLRAFHRLYFRARLPAIR
jgi:hypothetical protein